MQRDGFGQRVHDPLPDADHVGGVFHVFHEDDEFVPAEARHRVVGPHEHTQPVGDLYEHPVSGIVTEHVVHELEAVEIAEHHGELLAGTRAPP